MATTTVTTRQRVDSIITTTGSRFHGLPKSEQTRSPSVVSASKPALSSLLSRLAQQCQVPQSAVKDAYPCSPFQIVRIRESIAVTGLRHSHQVYGLREEIQENIALFERCWQYACNRNPILRTRVASIGDARSNRDTLVQVVVEDDFRWQVVDDTKTYQHSEHFTNPLKPGSPLVYFAIDKALKYFVLTMHHALYDAYTLSLIWADVKEAWNANGEVAGAVPRPPYSRFVGYLQKPPSDGTSDGWTRPLQSSKDDEETRKWPNATQVTGGVLPIDAPLPETGNVRHSAVIKAAWACTLMEAFKTNDIVFPDYFTGRCCPVPGILDIAGPTICAFPFRVQSKPDIKLSQVLAEVQAEVTNILKKEHWGALSPNASAYTPTSGQYGLNVINVFQDADGKQDHMWLNGLEPVAGEFGFRGGWDCMTRIIMQKHQVIWTFFADKSRLGDEISEHISARFPELLEAFSNPKNHERKMVDLIEV